MKYITIFLFGLLVGCGTTTLSVPPNVKPTESVIPTLKRVDSNIDTTVQTNIKLEQKIKEQQQTVSEQKADIQDAITDAENLKNKILSNDTITELETTNLIDKLKKVETRNLFLENQNGELSHVREDLQKPLQTLKVDSTKAYEQLVSKENETSQLREQYNYISKNLSLKNSEVENLKSDLTKEKVKSATAGVYRNWIIGIVSAFVLWTVIKNIIMIYSPIKFRI